jgi:hypothetical protein
MTKSFFQKNQKKKKYHYEKHPKVKTQLKKEKKYSTTKKEVLDFDKILKVLFEVPYHKKDNVTSPLQNKKQNRNELYDINNFLSNNVIKIAEQNSNSHIKIECPKFRELNDKEISSYDKTVKIKENVSDKMFIKKHKIYEINELEYRRIEKPSKKKLSGNKNSSYSNIKEVSSNTNSVNTSLTDNILSSISTRFKQEKDQGVLSLLSISESAETACGDKI